MIPPSGDPRVPENEAVDAPPSEALETELGALEALLPERGSPDLADATRAEEAEEEGGGDGPA